MISLSGLSAAALRAVFNDMAAAVIVVDERGRCVEANPAACSLLGYRYEHLLELHLAALTFASGERIEEIRRRLDDQPLRIETELRRRDGTSVEVEVALSAIVLADARLFVGVIQEIGERRLIENALRESEARLQSMVETSPDLLCVLDAEGCFRFVNSAYERVLGYTPADLIGRPTTEILHPDDTPSLMARLRALMVEINAGTSRRIGRHDLACRVRHADGRWIEIEARWQTLVDTSGAFVGILLIARDVTERRRVEEALRASEERFRSLVQNAADIVSIIDERGMLRYVSPAVERVLGYSADELLGTSPLQWVAPHDVEHVTAAFDQLRDVPGAQTTVEFGALRRDGSTVYLHAVATNLMHLPSVGGRVINAHDVTEQKLLEEQLIHQAFHDPLTGLPNRALLMDRLQQALARIERYRSSFAVLLLDLDRFKVVNDSLGHAMGDDLLIQVAERLMRSVRPGDTVARLGGDEFTILIEDAAAASGADAAAERLLDVLRGPFLLGDREVHIGASIGITCGTGEHDTPADLLREADNALYAAKGAGRGRAVRFAPHMNRAARQMDLAGILRRAIEHDELTIRFQPIVNLRNGAVAAVEAVARWSHPERGPIDPAEFIPIAEEAGLIDELWRSVVESVCRQAGAWQRVRSSDNPLHVSIKISPGQMQRPDLTRQIGKMLERTALTPGLLHLEVTESALLSDTNTALGVLRSVQALGVQLTIDTVGTGYAALNHLRRLPVSMLKLDRSFIQELADDPARAAAIVESICTLAHALGLKVVVDGVEQPWQVAVLRTLSVDYAQGAYLAAPLPAEDVPGVLGDGAYWELLEVADQSVA